MGWIKRTWTPKEAEKWTKEDTITVIISPLIYLMLMIGIALSALLIPIGFVILLVSVILLVVLVFIINPKLSAISEEYERKQKDYLKALDKKIKWED